MVIEMTKKSKGMFKNKLEGRSLFMYVLGLKVEFKTQI